VFKTGTDSWVSQWHFHTSTYDALSSFGELFLGMSFRLLLQVFSCFCYKYHPHGCRFLISCKIVKILSIFLFYVSILKAKSWKLSFNIEVNPFGVIIFHHGILTDLPFAMYLLLVFLPSVVLI
jgi:hypothetical protein